jgi:hypothetical protein
MLYYSIKQLESVGFDKKEIYVAISGDDLKEYEADERVVPIESRLPDANFIRVRQVESSMDTLRQDYLCSIASFNFKQIQNIY